MKFIENVNTNRLSNDQLGVIASTLMCKMSKCSEGRFAEQHRRSDLKECCILEL